MTTTFKKFSDHGDVLDWCYEQFGLPLHTSKGRWDTHQASMKEHKGIAREHCRIFIFHSKEDAMAFKLRWL